MFPIFQRPDLIVKSLDGDAAVERVKAGNEPRHRGGRISDRATEEANKLLEKEGAKNPEVKKATDDVRKKLGF